jgi:signal transduction histidine kinase/CheY-like chemotaxis protein/HPt (histidine-containing phosphotransfer) domain-containing protein
MHSLWSNTHPSQPLMLGTAAAVVVFATALLSSGALYLRAYDALFDEVRSDLRRTAVVAAAAIDADLHRQLNDPAQEGGTIYEQAVTPLRKILRSSTSIRYIYTCVLRDGVVHFVLDPTPKGDADGDGVEDHSFLMDPYPEANPDLRGVLAGGPATADPAPVEDSWGITISGYAPFHDDLGNTIGAVGVDIDLATFESRINGMRSALGLGLLLALGCSVLVGVVVLRSLRSLRQARLMADENARILRSERQDAERANRAKDEFLAVMTHEIRTPLNAVIGLADLLIAGDPEPEQRRHLATIRASGEHLLSMINDILDHSKIDAGHMTLEEAPFSPGEAAAEVVSLMQEAARAKGLRLEAQIDGPVSERVIGDPMRLRQVLINLVSNAIKFTSTGGVTLGLRATHPGGAITFSVVDTGVGMDEAMRARLFKPFSQGDSSISRRFGGTGLGLSISQRLVKLMGGAISVDSAPGRGTAFAFTLPLPSTTRPTTSIQRTVPIVQVPRLRGRVLVVDDREVNRQVAMAMVRRLGVEVEEATDGRAALERLATAGIDLVLMDCQMPELDGAATTAELRLRENGRRHLPVIALSAAVTPADRERCRQSGMDGFLGKPIRLDQLANELARFLPGDAGVPVPTPATVTHEPPAHAVLDAQVVATLRSLDSDPAAFARMVDTYLREAEATIASIVFDGVAGRREALATRAHAMKGAALTMGLTRLGQALDQFEAMTASGDDQTLAAAATDLEQVFADAAVALRQERDQAAGATGR